MPVSLIALSLTIKSSLVWKIMYVDALTLSYLFLDTVNKHYSTHNVPSTLLGPVCFALINL